MTFIIHQIIDSIVNSIPQLIGVNQFGSSCNQPHKYNDIDLIILSGQSFYSNFEEKLGVLTLALKEGNLPSGFSPDNSTFLVFENNLISDFNSKGDFRTCISFVFGPIIYSPNNNLIHIKGPLTLDELDYFKKMMPLHYNSMVSNNKLLFGENNLLNTRVTVDVKDYLEFQYGLIKRYINLSTPTHQRKIIFKIIQNFEAFSSEPFSIKSFQNTMDAANYLVIKDHIENFNDS